MEINFNQIFDFQYKQATKLHNSSYLEDLTELLASVASKLNRSDNYFFGEEFYIEKHRDEPNSSFKLFIQDFKNTIKHGSPEKINIIRGRAGIGKTLFFRRGILQLLRDEKKYSDQYIYMGVDFKNIDNNLSIEKYESWIYRHIYMNAIDNILLLGDEIRKVFDDEFEIYKKYDTYHKWLYPLKFFCEKILNKYNTPCIIVFDNIDLSSVPTQTNVFRAIVNVCGKFNEIMSKYHSPDCYRIYYIMRPETELRYIDGEIGAVINFPLPNILKISLAIMNKVLNETAKSFKDNNLPCHVTCENVMSDQDEMKTFETFTDVAEYFYKILDYYLTDIWNNSHQIVGRLGTSEEFHCNIVNYNVRTFQSFLSDTISNGGFKPLTEDFNKKQGARYYGVYDYIEMLIRGRWIVHPGNKHINGEGSNGAPIVFNIFETSLYGMTQNAKIKHFMLNIRILQYFFLCGDNFEVCYQDMQNTLSLFFDSDKIRNATKIMIYIRLLYSYKDGDKAIASKQSWQEVSIVETAKYKLTPVGRFYLEQLICEFEYLYQMALSSLMLDEYVKELRQCWKAEKERTVLCFLKSIFKILQLNIKDYSPDELATFRNMYYFVDDIRGSKPFRRMLNRFISAMNNKVQRAEKLDTNNTSKLKDILNDAIDFQNEALNYFASKLGE